MTANEWKWTSRDGLEMYARGWIPAEQPKAVICLVHGLGEHVNRYNHVGEAFTAAGYVLQGFDLRGHGQSGGPRGHTPSYESLLNDISDFQADAKKRHPGLPVFLYGHSMGGNQVINYALRYPDGLRGVIVTSPWLQLVSRPGAILSFLLKIISAIFPSFSQPNGLKLADISRDPKIVSAYAADPLVHDKISARLFTVMDANALGALERAATLKVPMLLMHGSADRISSADGSKEFAEKAGNIVTLRIWQGLYHETHNEPEKAEVIRAMLDWIGAHL
ncbi:MAG: lysophospholipase [Anaerolineales bacterium]